MPAFSYIEPLPNKSDTRIPDTKGYSGLHLFLSKSTASTNVTITRIPFSAIHMFSVGFCVAKVNPPLIRAFQSVCTMTLGQILPVLSRTQDRMAPNGKAAIITVAAENQ